MSTALYTDKEQLLRQLSDFINSIGIECREGVIPEATFLPGIDIQQGCIVYDRERIAHPGDLLHEAGHVAVLLPEHRRVAQSPDNINGDLQAGGAEMAAIAWSWAALKHLDIAPEVVFHKDGYAGGSENLISNFKDKHYLAVSMLQWLGMTNEPQKQQEQRADVYPAMKAWVRPATPVL